MREKTAPACLRNQEGQAKFGVIQSPFLFQNTFSFGNCSK